MLPMRRRARRRHDNSTDVTGDAGKDFVARVLGSTERVWDGVFQQMGQTYQKPTLVLFTGFVQSACGMAQSAMGPFYCPRDSKVYIDLSFYQDMKNKLGAPGDAAQGYVIAQWRTSQSPATEPEWLRQVRRKPAPAMKSARPSHCPA